MRRHRIRSITLAGLTVVAIGATALFTILAVNAWNDPNRDQSVTGLFGFLGTLTGLVSFLCLFLQAGAWLRHWSGANDPVPVLRKQVRSIFDRRLRMMRLGDEDIPLRYRGTQSSDRVELEAISVGDRYSERVVFVGPGGAGKSYSAMRIALSIVRETRMQLPLLVPLSQWDPSREWSEWLWEFAGMSLRRSPDTARELVEDGRLVPILDGMDEVTSEQGNAELQAGLRQILQWRVLDRPGPFVLTSRPDAWSQLGKGLRDHPSLRVLHVLPVQVQDSRRFAGRVLGDTEGVELMEGLAVAGATEVALSPWRLTMACVIAREAGPDAATAAAVRGDLVHEFVSATARRAHATVWGRLTLSLDLWWLAAYARYLASNGRTHERIGSQRLADADLELHRLWPAAGRLAPRVVDLLLALVMSIPGLAWGALYLWGRGALADGAVIVGVVAWGSLLVRTTLTPWVAPATQDFSRLRDPGFLVRQLVAALAVFIVSALLFGPPTALLASLTAWVTIGLTVGFGQTLATDSRVGVSGPRDVLARERKVSRFAAWSMLPLLTLAFAQSWGWPWGASAAATYCALVGETVGCALWRRYLAMIISSRLRLTPTPARTLDAMHALGLLRVAGDAYQFRHDELLQYFAGRSESAFTLVRGRTKRM